MYAPDGIVVIRPTHCDACGRPFPKPQGIFGNYADLANGTALCYQCAAEWELTAAAQTGCMFGYPNIAEHAAVTNATGYILSDPGSVDLGREYRGNWGDKRQHIRFAMCGRRWHGVIYGGMYIRARACKRRTRR